MRELLKTCAYDCYADLIADLKDRCGRYHIRGYTPQDITEALRLIESNRPLITEPKR